jgi:hypothetical protein
MSTGHQGSSMVEIRLFKKGDDKANWKSVKVAAYLPTFLSGEQNVSNVNKRIVLMYFKRPSDVQSICWLVQGETDVVWLDSPFLDTV